MASSRLLSSSVSWPSICNRTRRPSDCERSRTIRGIFEKTCETGCIRAFITLSRRSAVTMSSRRDSSVMWGSDAVACSTWLRVSTSSPTRFIIRFSSVTSTRRVLSAAVPAPCARGLPTSPSASPGAFSPAALGVGAAGSRAASAASGAGGAPGLCADPSAGNAAGDGAAIAADPPVSWVGACAGAAGWASAGVPATAPAAAAPART